MLFLRLNHIELGERKLLKRIVSGIMFTLLLIGMISTVFNIMPVAATEFGGFEVYISPEFPTTHDEVNATVGFWFLGSRPAFVRFSNLTRDGYTFMADINFSMVFLDIYGRWIYNHTYCLDTLPQGSYSFIATTYRVLNETTRYMFAGVIKPFTVTPNIDFNNDGRIDEDDVWIFCAYFITYYTYGFRDDMKPFDFNNNGKIDEDDLWTFCGAFIDYYKAH